MAVSKINQILTFFHHLLTNCTVLLLMVNLKWKSFQLLSFITYQMLTAKLF